jgi:phosphonate transport system substrate-binding protein
MKKILVLLVAIIAIFMVGCKEELPTLVLGGIPDQNTATLNERFEELAAYIQEETGIETEYLPSADYSALVTGFGREEVHLGWFGGLTGVQARALVENSEAIAHRPRDEKFQSVFVANKEAGITSLEDLQGKSFTFGSESSTSGHLMPRFFLMENGLNPDETFNSVPNYSGSHDKTWTLVESGAFDAGALNIAVWESAVEEGKVDLEKVDVFYTTPHYFDYNWTVGNVDQIYGEGTKGKIKEALLSFGQANPDMMALFQDDSFVETNNENYDAILEVAKALGIIE